MKFLPTYKTYLNAIDGFCLLYKNQNYYTLGVELKICRLFFDFSVKYTHPEYKRIICFT